MLRWIAGLFLLFVAAGGVAQAPSDEWRTVATAHYRVHYPRAYEAWANRAASRLESIHEAVVAEVGFTPAQTIDVVIMNPVAEANGSAWPLLDAPRIVFWTEPPGPEEVIGAYSHWIDLLAVHEVAHVVHMLRPSRNPTWRLFERFVLPLNPITLRSPRWVLEGYATVVEGRLTGAGRPSSTMRAMILRKWAQTGRLPGYQQLDSDQRFLGMSMAYLMGSAYLEWLEQRNGEGSLRRVWVRMTARQSRTFDQAFMGVFGESPERLYGRFVAELTEAAVTIDRAGGLREGELWQETSRASGDPAVSSDHSKIAVVLRQRGKPAQLVVWSTGPADEEEERFSSRLKQILQRDPEDYAPLRSKPLPRRALRQYSPGDGGDVETPRWTRDGRSLLFTRKQADADGFLHNDLYLWTIEGGNVERLTRLADVSDADPLPDGRSAIAVRSRYGATQLVRVDLTTGRVTPITEPSIDIVYDHPRVSPNGMRLAYIAHRSGRWRLECGNLRETFEARDCRSDLEADAASPEWLSNDELVATLSSRGFAELHRIALDGAVVPLTRSGSGALQPAPAGERIFFMGLEPDGFVVRVVDATPAATPRAPFDRPLVPALPPAAPVVAPFAAQPLDPARDYGIGKQEWSWFAGEQLGPEQQSIEAGLRLGDIIGRLDTLFIGAAGNDDAFSGFAIASAWRGWPVELSAHAFTAEQREDDRSGVEVRGLWSHRGTQHRFTIEGGGLAAEPSTLAFAESSYTRVQRRRGWRATEMLRVAGEAGDFKHIVSEARATFTMSGITVGGQFRRDHIDDGTNLSVGGLLPALLPASALATRISDPALPPGTLTGGDYQGRRFDLQFSGVTAFYQEHRIREGSLAVAGLEVAVSSDPLPLLRAAGVDATVGVAHILDEPFRGDTKWWVAIRWRP